MRKITQFFAKLFQAIYEAKLANIVYLILFAYFYITGATFLAGATFGIFVYINFNTFEKLLNDKFRK